MDKQTLERDMKSQANGKGFMSMNQIAKFLGQDPRSVKKLLAGVDYLPSGKAHLYLIKDVAGRIIESTKCS